MVNSSRGLTSGKPWPRGEVMTSQQTGTARWELHQARADAFGLAGNPRYSQTQMRGIGRTQVRSADAVCISNIPVSVFP